MTTQLDVPQRLQQRPVTRGFVVPWFVAEVEPGVYDFRYADDRKLVEAHNRDLCWMCGEARGRWQTFIVGPMCAINRISSEPPSHRECAEYAAAVCPFLTQREHKRRPNDRPEASHPAGVMIERQPGVTLLWISREPYRLVRPPTGGILFGMGEPSECIWQCEGRDATRDEVEASIVSGLPELLAADGGSDQAARVLEQRRRAIEPLLPRA